MPAASLVMGGVEPQHAGSASGLLQTVQQLGGVIGLAVVSRSTPPEPSPASSSPAPAPHS